MGVAESVFATEISPTWSSFTFFIVLIAVLVVRPQGLFGARVRGAI
jgi:branched-chain amino acid transport system permease protein